jgi:hypothetical protein
MKTFLKVMAWIIVTPFVLWGLWWSYWTYTLYYAPYRGMKFTTEAWLEDGGGKIWPGTKTIVSGTANRCQMYDDLSTNHLRLGMKLEEVEKLLGPERAIYCLEKRIKCLSYSLNTCYASAWTISSGWLDICFNHRQEVIKWGKHGNAGPELYGTICDYKYAWFSSSKGYICEDGRIQFERGVISEKCSHEIEKW